MQVEFTEDELDRLHEMTKTALMLYTDSSIKAVKEGKLSEEDSEKALSPYRELYFKIQGT